jgi:hypothetical protein
MTTATATAVKDASFDYLYIESNEGGSSGGHTAIRFGEDIYHFQAEHGLLVLRRDRAKEFLYAYALLGNRTIHSTRIAVSEATFSGLLDQFRRRHRAQEAQIGVGSELLDDARFLEKLRDRESQPAQSFTSQTLRVRGLGYFETPSDHEMEAFDPALDSIPSEALVSLRDTITRIHGRDFLPSRRRALVDAMRTLARTNPSNWAIERPTSVYEHPAFSVSYSSRWRDLVAGLAALDILDDARALDKATHNVPTDAYFDLDSEEIRAFERYAQTLTGQLVRLVDSRRADWGEGLLIGMARLSALTRSIESGRLVFLDTFPEKSEVLDEERLAGRGKIRNLMLSENKDQLDASRAYFRNSPEGSELAWERVEERSNRFFEIKRALSQSHPMRVARGHLIPSHAAPYPIPFVLGLRIDQRSDDILRALERERSYSRALTRLHRYRLIDQNCATALFETINDRFEGSVETSRRKLGGHIGSRRSLAFIPFISARQVRARYTVVATETIPSYRHQRLTAMRDRESAFRVALRESNTFTAQAYERSSADSFFVFFTDEMLLLRPFFGVVNLTAAIGQIAWGIVAAPLDRGENLSRGLRGAFVSLPELAFSNIRKGSNEWIPDEHRNVSPLDHADDVPR